MLHGYMKRTLSILAALLMVGCNGYDGTIIEEKDGFLVTSVSATDRKDIILYSLQGSDGLRYRYYTSSEFKLGDFVEFTKQRPFP